MSELAVWLSIPVLIVEAVLGVLVGYLLLLTVAALFARRATDRPPEPKHRFAILIPAHDEERLLPETLASLVALDYPKALYDVHVVADNCTDRTAEIARSAGVHVYERFNTELVGKGHALNWLMEQIKGAGGQGAREQGSGGAGEQGSKARRMMLSQYDAIVIFDADTIVSPGFLRVMDAWLTRGENAVQGYYAVRDPTRSWGVALRYAALAVLHYLRPLGRSVLGGTTGFKGNGLCLRADLARRFAWSGSLTEDIQYHMELVLAGERVAFAPDAVLEAEMPGTLHGARTQNVRWERGRLQMIRAYVPQLLRAAFRQRRFVPFDAAMEQLIPPTAVLTALIGACTLAGVVLGLWGHWTVAGVGLALLAGEAIYLIVGLLLVRAPVRVWLALVYAPIFLIWKVGLYLRVLAGRERQGWVRTQR